MVRGMKKDSLLGTTNSPIMDTSKVFRHGLVMKAVKVHVPSPHKAVNG